MLNSPPPHPPPPTLYPTPALSLFQWLKYLMMVFRFGFVVKMRALAAHRLHLHAPEPQLLTVGGLLGGKLEVLTRPRFNSWVSLQAVCCGAALASEGATPNTSSLNVLDTFTPIETGPGQNCHFVSVLGSQSDLNEPVIGGLSCQSSQPSNEPPSVPRLSGRGWNLDLYKWLAGIRFWFEFFTEPCGFGSPIYNNGSEPGYSWGQHPPDHSVQNSDFITKLRSQSGLETNFIKSFGSGSFKLDLH